MKNDCGEVVLSKEAKERKAHVAILLCTYQGEAFLVEQLNSLLRQTYQNFSIWVSDDGSSDETLSILEHYRSLVGEERLAICKGPQKGFVANFLSLLRRRDLSADYFSFCDQDDIWTPDKLERALNMLSLVSSDVPALYGSRSCLIDCENKKIGLSPLYSRKLSFANALVQNFASGNTMVMNAAARNLVLATIDRVDITKIVVHDWWFYLVISGAGGHVVYDTRPCIFYRQHSDNLIGAKVRFSERVSRLWRRQFQEWVDRNVDSLFLIQGVLSQQNQETLRLFQRMRKALFIQRLRFFLKSQIYRQTIVGNLGLWVAVLLKKI